MLNRALNRAYNIVKTAIYLTSSLFTHILNWFEHKLVLVWVLSPTKPSIFSFRLTDKLSRAQKPN